MEILAACHVHSAWSYDGSWSLEDLSARFSRRGCRVLMMTEHDRGFTASRFLEYRKACLEASTDKILVVPGMEYSDADNRVHVLVWGDVPFLGEGLPTGRMLAAVKATGGIAVLAHPSRKKAWQCFDPEWAALLLGIEVWNRKYDGWAPSESFPALLKAAGVIPFVGLDFHSQRQLFPLVMALDIDMDKDQKLSEDTVVECFRNYRCSARAFGSPLSQEIFRAALPALRIAERSRRAVSSIARSSGVLGR
jgi:PHP domain-containing protein